MNEEYILRKWRKELPIILHPERLSILIVLYAYKIILELEWEQLHAFGNDYY